jgi:hypothetical protein
MMSKKTRTILISIILIVLFVFIFKWLAAIERIDAGHAGIRVNLVGTNKGVDDITEVTGWVIYAVIYCNI